MSESIVEEWLRSRNLSEYTVAFIDNGYDDLEICKQIGDPDLDAIGVTKAEHRAKLLSAVKTLREEGGTAVYFTLEYPTQSFDNEFSNDSVFAEIGPAPGSPRSTRETRAHLCTPKKALLTYPKLQLRHILSDRITEDDVDLTNPPYTNLNLTACRSSLTALAVKYATELRTHVDDVYDRMEELRQWFVRKDNESYYSPALGRPPGSIYSTSIYGHTTGPVPPPIPSCPPPSMSHMDRYADLQSVSTRYDSPNFHPNYVALETGMCCMFPRKTKKVTTTDKEDDKKKTSTIGKFFRSISFRKSSRKHGYKPAIGDLQASEITMNDEDRMALMLMVKDGTITTDTALEVVRRFEEEKKQDGDSIYSLKSDDSTERERGKKKKSCQTKPTKSPSAIYSDEGSRCEICQNYVSRDHVYQHNQTCQDSSNRLECCRHRRVHSVSHIEYLQQSSSPHFTRAMSCSPTNSPPTHLSTVGSPVMFHSPMHYGKIYSPVIPEELRLHTGIYSQAGYNLYKDRTNLLKTAAYVHKTPSKSSILSSESDHSMECGALPVDMAATRNDDGNYCSNSTVSMSSDTSPAPNNWQKETVADMSRLHKWHRSGSYSTGEDDGMSSENENIDRVSSGNTYHRSRTKSHQVKSDMKKKMLRSLNVEEGEITHSGVVYQIGTNKSASSMESNHSQTSGLGSQPSASPGSGRSHTPEDLLLYNCQFIGKAKVLSNYSPTAEEIKFLHLKEGEIIQIISMSHDGTWKGMLNGKVGNFHFAQTEIITETTPLCHLKDTLHQRRSQRPGPNSVEELMRRIGLEHLTSVFLLNGYDKLDKFAFMDEHDLNVLNIHDPQQRTRILTALELLLDYDAFAVTDSYDRAKVRSGVEKVHTGHRDSGCYGSSEQIIHRITDMQPVRVQKSSYSENKENYQPNHKLYCVKSSTISDDMSSSIYSSDSTRVNSEFDRSDKEYTEEDKEVGEITKYFSSGKKKILSNSIGSKPVEGQIVMYLCSSTQTSPSCGTSCERPTFSPTCHGASSSKNATIETTSRDVSPHKKPKPFPKKVAKIGPRCDAQVQAMSPMSSQIYASCKSVLKDSKIQSDSRCIERKSKSPPSFLNGYMQSTVSTLDSKISGSSERWTKMDDNQPTSIYGPVQKNYKAIRKSLVPLVTSKLAQEKIDLKQEPYSSKAGECGIPPLLIQRYADELKQDTRGVAAIMDQVRIHQLSSLGKTAVPANNLDETCTATCDLNISSINSFFTSIGLPMYAESFIRHRCTAVEQLVNLKEREIEEWTMADAKHLKRICHALEWVCGKLSSPSRKSKISSVKDRV